MHLVHGFLIRSAWVPRKVRGRFVWKVRVEGSWRVRGGLTSERSCGSVDGDGRHQLNVVGGRTQRGAIVLVPIYGRGRMHARRHQLNIVRGRTMSGVR